MPQYPPFQEWVIQITSIFSNVMVGVAAIVGIFGYFKWRREMVGRAKFDIAVKLIRISLQIQDKFRFARNIFSFSSESISRQKREDESHEESSVLDEHYAHIKRIEFLKESLLELRTTMLEAEAILASIDLSPIDNLFKLYQELFTVGA
jgi:hypothetical protein